MTQTQNASWTTSTGAELTGAGVHRATLPSGARVLVRFPPLGALVRSGTVPTELREHAIAEATRAGGAASLLADSVLESAPEDGPDTGAVSEQRWDATTAEIERLQHWYLWLVAEHTLVEPRLSIEQLRGDTIDERDVEWLIAIATRRVDRDAEGVRLGVMSLDDGAVFREEHRCAAAGGTCEDCARTQQRLSSPRVHPV